MRILIATDAFPPRCGGSGWSTYELARGLRSRGHEVCVAQPVPGARGGGRDYDGFAVREVAVTAPAVPFVRNYCKNERLYPRLARALGTMLAEMRADIVHGQHVLTIPATVIAARAAGIPSVATVRDYWPVCYWSDLIHDPADERLCPGCSASMMMRCIRPRARAAWPLALPLIPYMRRNLAMKRSRLAQAGAVIAVSSAIERDLRERAPELSATRIERIPNPVDCDAVAAQAGAGPAPLATPYAVYAGKLAPNKGASKLVAAVTRARLPWPLVVVGDGPSRVEVERAAREAGVTARFTGWLPRDEALVWLRHASLVVFPSHGPESLSRVLLEASVLARPIAAMDTGGTRDIVLNGSTGLLSANVEELGDHVARLVSHPDEAARLGEAAARHVRATFDAPRVLDQIEALYRRLLAGPAISRGSRGA